MNSFANSLFTALFGWARSLIQNIWTAATSGGLSGFFTWLGDHWLMAALILALIGTAIDLAIWLIRWRPYLAWRTRLRQIFHQAGPQTVGERRFDKGYQGGIALDMPAQDAPEEEAKQEEWSEEDWQQLPPEEAATPFAVPQDPEQEALTRSANRARQGRTRQFNPEQAYELPPIMPTSWLGQTYRTDLPAARRKRRSDKYEHKKPMWTDKLMIREVEEDSLLDGLPPAVDRSRAFHEPVYPSQRQQAGPSYADWLPPEDEESAEEKREE